MKKYRELFLNLKAMNDFSACRAGGFSFIENTKSEVLFLKDEKYYHLTTRENAKSILKNGLLIMHGVNSKAISDERKGIFFVQKKRYTLLANIAWA